MDISPRTLVKHRLTLTALLLLALLSLQAALLVHHYEFDEHAEGELCQLCLNQSSNGKYLSSAIVAVSFLPASYLIEVAGDVVQRPAECSRHYIARAPPLTFFS